MSGTHPVRIGRGREPRAVRLPVDPTGTGAEPSSGPTPNRGGRARALRTGVLFLLVMTLLYGALAAYDRSTPGGTSLGASQGFEWFSLVAVVIGVGGFLFSFGVAPRAVELRPDATIVFGAYGRVVRFPKDSTYTAKVVRRFPAGILSNEAVESVELRSNGVRRTFLVEPGLIPESV
jgi:hypothetical protein